MPNGRHIFDCPRYKQLRRESNCYRCEEKGHWADACPTRGMAVNPSYWHAPVYSVEGGKGENGVAKIINVTNAVEAREEKQRMKEDAIEQAHWPQQEVIDRAMAEDLAKASEAIDVDAEKGVESEEWDLGVYLSEEEKEEKAEQEEQEEQEEVVQKEQELPDPEQPSKPYSPFSDFKDDTKDKFYKRMRKNKPASPIKKKNRPEAKSKRRKRMPEVKLFLIFNLF